MESAREREEEDACGGAGMDGWSDRSGTRRVSVGSDGGLGLLLGETLEVAVVVGVASKSDVVSCEACGRSSWKWF